MDVGFGTIWEAVTDRLPDVPAITEPGRDLQPVQSSTSARPGWPPRSPTPASGRATPSPATSTTARPTSRPCSRPSSSAPSRSTRTTGTPDPSWPRCWPTPMPRCSSSARRWPPTSSRPPSRCRPSSSWSAPGTTTTAHRSPAAGPRRPAGHARPAPHDRAPAPTDCSCTPAARRVGRRGSSGSRPTCCTPHRPDLRPPGPALPESLEEAVEAAVDARARDLTPTTMPVVPLMHGTGLFNTIGALLVGGPRRLRATRPVRPPAAGRPSPRTPSAPSSSPATPSPAPGGRARPAEEGRPHDLSSLRSISARGRRCPTS